jgi:H+-transporting ATPase
VKSLAGELAMATVPKQSAAEISTAKPAAAKIPDNVAASVSETLAALRVNPETGLTSTEVDTRRKEHGYNEVAESKEHPILRFLSKFWGLSAWMLELIMVLSAVLRKFSDLAVVSALLIVNAVLSFAQERRAAGVVETLRKRLQVSARVRRDAGWHLDYAHNQRSERWSRSGDAAGG